MLLGQPARKTGLFLRLPHRLKAGLFVYEKNKYYKNSNGKNLLAIEVIYELKIACGRIPICGIRLLFEYRPMRFCYVPTAFEYTAFPSKETKY